MFRLYAIVTASTGFDPAAAARLSRSPAAAATLATSMSMQIHAEQARR
jgi:hypothetical protein